MITPLPPAVYRLKFSKKTGYYLEYYKPYFDVTGKNYGKIDAHVSLFWRKFVASCNSMGAMLTGAAGSGKSRVGELLGNRGIDNGMCVVMITDINPDTEIIPFIDNLHNMILIFDEFSKNFNMRLQNKMLTMFSSVGPMKKLFIITENSRHTVSPYIRTRPGRIRYAVDYDRISVDVVEDYCADHNVSDDYINDIMNIYTKASKFTFDHLQALVTEKEFNVDMSIDDIMEVLNLDDLLIPERWRIDSVTNVDTGIPWVLTGRTEPLAKDFINSKRFYQWVDFTSPVEVVDDEVVNKPIVRNSVKVDNTTLREINDSGCIIHRVDGFDIAFRIVE